MTSPPRMTTTGNGQAGTLNTRSEVIICWQDPFSMVGETREDPIRRLLDLVSLVWSSLVVSSTLPSGSPRLVSFLLSFQSAHKTLAP